MAQAGLQTGRIGAVVRQAAAHEMAERGTL